VHACGRLTDTIINIRGQSLNSERERIGVTS
jgi:hypothetical protein